MFYLLDINVLIASAHPSHEFHQAFHKWFPSAGSPPLATCPLTENGFLRIYGHSSFPGEPGSPDAALPPLIAIRERPGFRFLADDLSLADPSIGVDLSGAAPKHLTDLYLLALAAKHGGKFATFDTRIPHHRLPGGSAAIEIVAP